jgi:hypothetical protein
MDKRNTLTGRWFRLLSFAALLGVFAGCALTARQKAAVSKFSGSAVTLGDITSSELIAMRDDAVKMTIERLLLGGKSKNSNLGDQASLDRGFEMEKVETVSGATQALAAYGRSLAALIDKKQSTDLAAACNEFVATLGRVPAARECVTDEQLQAIGSVAGIVGGIWTDWKRKKAVAMIVASARGAVEHLCDLLIRDFDPEKGWVALQLQVIEGPLMGEATNGLYDGKTYNDRKVSVEAFRLAHDSRMRRTEVLHRVTGAATAMKKANNALVKAMETSVWSSHDIQDFAEKTRSLATAVTIIMTKGKE